MNLFALQGKFCLPNDTTSSSEASWFSHDLQVGQDPLALIESEWLLTNGTGAYAMGTVPGVNTRRYHGLLIAATQPPVGRVMVLNQMLEQVSLQKNGSEQPLAFATCAFQADDGNRVLSPQGHTLLRRVRKGLTVQWCYSWGHVQFIRHLYLHWQKQAVTISYQIKGLDQAQSAARLALSPLITLRDFHALSSASQPSATITAQPQHFVARHGSTTATFGCPGSIFKASPQWWNRVWLSAETERGEQDHEDLFSPGCFELELEPKPCHHVALTVALGPTPIQPEPTDLPRRRHIAGLRLQGSDKENSTDRLLIAASDDFVVSRTVGGQTLRTIIAGYPWFADWGRDTFIALPGLLLATGRGDEAKATLRAFANALHNGLVPNRFDDYNNLAAHYNTVDASLWFAHAAMQYFLETDDVESWRQWLADAVLQIIDAYIRGTDFDIRMAGDGLITAGTEGTQLTWMDAACAGVVFTPRHGKAVEINALWYHVLAGMAELVADFRRDRAEHFRRLTARIRRAFAKVFWDDQLDCLIDHVWTDAAGNDQPDRTVRPNQIFAVSLPHSPIPRTKQQKVLDVVRRQLLTPFGLRTLACDDPRYHGHYSGDRYHRDQAYHQGTVWPWLIGPYAEAVLRLGRFSTKSKAAAQQALAPLLDRLTGPGLGQLHEIHEADAPHRPVGCPAQAWSVAEVLRLSRMIHRGR